MARVAVLPPELEAREAVKTAWDDEDISPVKEEPAGSSNDAKSADDAIGVRFGRLGLVLVWLGIYTLHAVCAVYLVVAGRIYWELPTTTVGGLFEMYKITLDKKHLKSIGVVHYVIGSIHLYILVKALFIAVYRLIVPRKLQARVTGLQKRVQASIHKRIDTVSVFERVRSFRGAHTKLRAVLRTAYRALFARDGLFGVASGHYELFFLAREVTETILQSNQAYTMSRLLPRASLNRFYVVILIVNCWATPLLHHVFRRNPSHQLLLCLLCDVVLDFVSSIGVPIVLAISYIKVYDFEWEDYKPWVWYNDKWLINIMNETPLIFCNSWVDLGSRLLFLLCLLSSMEDVRTLIKPRDTRVGPNTKPNAPAPVTATAQDAVKKKSGSFTSSASGATIVALIVKWSHRMMVLYGFAILTAFLHSEFKPSPAACVLEVRPWLVSQPACALIEINCLLDPSRTANRDDFEAITKHLDPSSLEHISIRHCPHVELTPRLQTFTNLLGIKIYNSTVVSWDDDAAFTATHHTRIRFAYFPYTQFPDNTLPAGLVSKDFPPTLRDFRVAVSNIDSVPDDLHERWPLVMTIMFELTQFSHFPVTLAKLQPWFLSLMGNTITDYPRAAFEDNNIQQIMMLGNVITYLPEDVDADRVSMNGVFLDSTNLSAIPQWMDESYLTRVWVTAGDSPICRDILLNPNSTEGQALALERPYLLTLLDCSQYPPWPTYRLDLEASGRPDEVWQ